MRYHQFEFTAFTAQDVNTNYLSCGSSFTLPSCASTCISVCDNDVFLSGDNYCNENADDRYGQKAQIAREGMEQGNGGQIYAESYYWVKDHYGNRYIMINIEQEKSGNDYFTFYQGFGYSIPPAGTELTVVSGPKVCSDWLNYNCLGAGEKGSMKGSVSGRVFIDSDCDGLEGSAGCTLGNNLLINGDFEDNCLNNSGSSLGGASGLRAWQDKGLADAQVHEQNYGHGNARGDAIVELEKGVVLCQRVDVPESSDYVLSFDLTRRGYNSQDNSFELVIDGELYQTYKVTKNTTINIELTLSSGSHEFEFRSLSRSFKGAGLDDVKLQKKVVTEVEAGQAGIRVYLLDEAGRYILDKQGQAISTLTDSNGEYYFDDVAAGRYRVCFEAPDDNLFTQQNVGCDERIDSDVNAQGVSDVFTIVACKETTDIDAGIKNKPNTVPVAEDDKASGCYDEAIVVDALANDYDADGDSLSITAINGLALVEGAAAVEIDGVFVELFQGQLLFDGLDVYEGLVTGETANKTFYYTVSDGKGGKATAEIDVTFKGATDSLDKIEGLLPDQLVGLQVIDESFDDGNGVGSGAFTVKLSNAGSISNTYAQAYCLDFFDSINPGGFGTNIDDAPLVDATLTLASIDYLSQEQQNALGTNSTLNPLSGGINGESAADNLDLINWIINQSFETKYNGDAVIANYTEAEIQGAIWALSDGQSIAQGDPVNGIPTLADGIFVEEGFGTAANAKEILDLALAQGEGFVAGDGDLVGVFVDPQGSPEFTQPYIIGIDLFDDCCVC